MPDGLYILVDFAEPLRIGFIRSDGKDGAFDYYNSFTNMVKDAEVVHQGSPETWPWHSPATDTYQQHVAKCPSREEALKYIAEKTAIKA